VAFDARYASACRLYICGHLLRHKSSLGYLPIHKFGADGLLQVISQRYERCSTVITTKRAFKHWPEIFNNNSTLTSALIDRLLHHGESIVINGRSYRMRDQSDT
jgi:DNA replication protein DnaC